MSSADSDMPVKQFCRQATAGFKTEEAIAVGHVKCVFDKFEAGKGAA